MSDLEPTPDDAQPDDAQPDDLAVSSVLDGLASLEESERVASDPRLAARLSQLRAAAQAVRGPVPLVDPATREAHLARARAAFAEVVAERSASPRTPAAAAPPPPPLPPAPPRPVPATSAPVTDLAAARARRRPPGGARILSIAAAVLLVLGVGAFIVATNATGGGGDEAASNTSDDTSAAFSAADSGEAGGGVADAPQATIPPGGDETAVEGSSAGSSATTVPDSASGAASAEDFATSVPSLGAFAKTSDLADSVRGRLALEPAPRAAGIDPACQDDFDAPVTLLGRATVAGQEGLVYVEAQPTTDRHLWFVDPTTAGAQGEACRRIVPVQPL